MVRSVTVRGVPDEVHAALVRRAAAAGLSLSEFLRRELEVIAARGANDVLLGELALLPSRGGFGTDVVRAERDRRAAELTDRIARC